MEKEQKQSPIFIVDDDTDDLELISEAAARLNITRPIHFFRNGDELLEFLRNDTVSPFLIICDVNLLNETGFDVKKRIYDDQVLRYKSVPFIFWSTSASEKQIKHAYDLPAQGFFFKPTDFAELCNILQTIVHYWQISQHPKQVA